MRPPTTASSRATVASLRGSKPLARPLPTATSLPSPSRRSTHSAAARPTLRPTRTTQQVRNLLRPASSSAPANDSAHGVYPAAEHCDAVILGGGVVGLALAAALVASPQLAASAAVTGSALRLILLDAADLTRLTGWASQKEKLFSELQAKGRPGDIDFENRVVSLTDDNWRWLQEIGVTPYLVQHRVHPVTAMHVTDGLTGAAIDLGESRRSSSSSSEASSATLSHMVELTNLQQALLRFVYSRSVEADAGVKVQVWERSKVEDISPDAAVTSANGQYADAWPTVTVAGAEETTTHIRPRLLIGADGPSSPVRRYAGIEKYGWPYHRKGLVGTFRFDPAHQALKGGGDTTAYQRFLKTGTIAWLPLSDSTASTVWALPPDLAQTITALHRATTSAKQPSIMADLVNAAWRLPWSSLATILTLVPTMTAADDVHAVTVAADTLRQQIRAHLEAAEREGTIVAEQDCPPVVADVDAPSVASFPLSVAHTECYLGSSLATRGPSPSGFLQSAMSLTSFWTPEKETSRVAQARTVLVGDAAHTIHPLAGQGLNLGLADVQSLARTLSAATSVGGDWGSHESLKGYERERYLANQGMLSGVDHLFWLFDIGGETLEEAKRRGGAPLSASQSFRPSNLLADGTVWARSTGMEVLNELDWIKRRVQKTAGS